MFIIMLCVCLASSVRCAGDFSIPSSWRHNGGDSQCRVSRLRNPKAFGLKKLAISYNEIGDSVTVETGGVSFVAQVDRTGGSEIFQYTVKTSGIMFEHGYFKLSNNHAQFRGMRPGVRDCYSWLDKDLSLWSGSPVNYICYTAQRDSLYVWRFFRRCDDGRSAFMMLRFIYNEPKEPNFFVGLTDEYTFQYGGLNRALVD